MERKQIIPWKRFNSVNIPVGVFCIEGLSALAKLTYGLLCWHSGKNGNCYPQQQTIAKELGISRRHVNRLLNELVGHNLIEQRTPTGQERLSHKSTRYIFFDHECFDKDFPCLLQETPGCDIHVTPVCDADVTPKGRDLLEREEDSSKEEESNDPQAAHTKSRGVLVKREGSLEVPKPDHKPKERKSLPCPAIVKHYLDIWHKFPVRKHFKQNTVAYEKAVNDLRMLIRGTFFDQLPVDDGFKNRKFSPIEFEKAAYRFSQSITNLLCYPKNKKFFKNMSVSDFLYYNNSIENKSQFLYFLENEPELIEVDKNPKLTSAIMRVLQSATGKDFSTSSQQMDKFLMSSRRLHKYWGENKSRLNGRFYSDEMIAKVLVESVLFDTDGKDITPGWLCSNETFDRRLPEYCEDHIWVTRRR